MRINFVHYPESQDSDVKGGKTFQACKYDN
jgi:hypothetical protein